MRIHIPTHRLREGFQQGRLLGNRHAPRMAFGRTYAWMMTALFLVSTAVGVLQPFFPAKAYALDDAARAILPEPTPEFSKLLQFDAKSQAYHFNQGYIPGGSGGGPRIMATFYQDPSKGITVTDPVNSLDFGMRAEFGLGQPEKNQNQIMYRTLDTPGYLVYTGQVDSVKEDILVARYSGDRLSYDFNLDLPDGTQARVEANGSLGIYGSQVPLYGQVTTGTQQDAALLSQARQNSAKTKLLANIPAPVVVESGRKISRVKSRYELDGSQVRIVVDHLQNATYPLAIDPSIYIETAQKLMRGNNETNVDFNTTNELIQKGELTGGRFDSWTNTTYLPNNRMSMGTAVGGGFIYVAGGLQSNTRQQSVYWAKFNTTTNTIDAPNPGNGSCSSWCTNSVYNLPVALSNFSMVYYSGFLYVMGGETNSGYSNAVYIAKLGANGEPSLWHPSDPNPSNWVYWYTDTSFNLSSARSQFGAAAYNNRMYIVGGQTASASGGITNVEVANINPMGTLGSWSTTGTVSIPTMRRAHNIQIYNDRMYLIGGISNVTPQSSIQYIKLNSDGTMAGSWSTAISMLKARFSEGGTFSTIWGGYLYVAGGCQAVTGTGNWCSVSGLSAAQDIELASINTDGSVTNWTAINGINAQRTNYGLVSWRKTIYAIGGCTGANDTTGVCASDTAQTQYGAINNAGDVSTTNNSSSPGTGSCTGSNPTNCDIPPAGSAAGQIGNMVDGVALNNGYIYLIGGCTVVTSTSNCYNRNTGAMSPNIAYAALAVDGSVTIPSNCTGTGMTLYGSWCVDSTHQINPNTGMGAMATAVYNNVLYAIGGTDGGSWSANIFRVGLNNDGSLAGAWTSQSFSSMNLGVARGFAYAYSRANPASPTVDPGVLFVIGGCNNGLKSNGIPCSTYYNGVYKCYITPSGAIDTTNQCTTAGQLQLDSENDGTGLGLAGMAGTVYAGYMYLIGGTSPNQSARGTVMYARIDDNDNIVAAPGGTGWITSPNQITPIRQRGAAFGYNGYLYSLAGYNSTGSLNDVLYAKINVNDGSIGAFKPSSVTVVPRWGLMSVVANGFVYAMGGCSQGQAPTYCTAMTQTTQTFQLYNNYSGTPAGYTATNALSVDRVGGSAAVLNGYVYYAGGCSDMACTAPQNTVYYAPLNANGTLGTWTASPNSLPAVRAWGKLVAQGGYLYYLGGQDASGTAQSSVYYSQPSSGVPGAWATATNGLPAAVTEIGAAVWNNRLYVTGGSSGGSRQTSIYYSPSIPNGGDITAAWTTNPTGFNIARSGHTAITYANNLYIIGGYTGSAYLADVQYAKIASNGSVGSWSYTTSLPQYTYEADGFAANGYMYLFGGRSASTTCSNSAFVSAISANTTIASGNNPTGVGDWSQTNVKFNAARYGAATAYGDGRAYVLGGGCSAFVGAGDRSYATALQSQPAVAKYSRMIDADSDVFPTKWLMNGLDNDIGARWQLKYRSMSNPLVTDPTKMCASSVMNTWGQEVNYGTVSLGTPQTYTAKDGSGNTIPCARYYFLNVSIDSSKAFGYPDDVTRGPTVDDITLFFTADPSKRLRHGKTFTGGQLQPLDTPF